MGIGRGQGHTVVSSKTAEWQSVVMCFEAVGELVAAVFFKPVLAQIARKLTEIAQGNGMEGRSPEQRWGHTGKTVKCWLVVVCFKTVDRLILATPLSLCSAKLQEN